MRHLRSRVAVVALVLIGAVLVRAQDVRETYQTYCATCHGAQLDGGLGGNLVDDTWKYSADDDSLTRVIREGVLDAGMPAFGAALDDAQVRGLVVYIREMGARAAAAQTTFNRPTPETVTISEVQRFRLEVITDHLEIPWSLAFLPDGRLLVTERAGRLRVITNGRLKSEPIAGTPEVWARSQGGLLSVAVHPDFAENGWCCVEVIKEMIGHCQTRLGFRHDFPELGG